MKSFLLIAGSVDAIKQQGKKDHGNNPLTFKWLHLIYCYSSLLFSLSLSLEYSVIPSSPLIQEENDPLIAPLGNLMMEKMRREKINQGKKLIERKRDETIGSYPFHEYKSALHLMSTFQYTINNEKFNEYSSFSPILPHTKGKKILERKETLTSRPFRRGRKQEQKEKCFKKKKIKLNFFPRSTFWFRPDSIQYQKCFIPSFETYLIQIKTQRGWKEMVKKSSGKS